ncbi:MAG: alpha/beta fold hydrolase [Pseudomonadales bacterium]|nr:alpha/beta fold hydrolase [Pseudomonadales bacterium]
MLTPSLLSRRLASRLSNARDRLFHAQQLSRAGQRAYRVIHHDGLISVRHYPRTQGSAQNPLVLVAPLAVNMLIYDLFPERSLVSYLTDAGKDVYLIDWGPPTRRHNHYTLATYVLELLPTCLTAIRQHAQRTQLDLHGWSLGGHLVLCHAGRGLDTDIAHIIILGTSIDSHASGSIGQLARRMDRSLQFLERRTGLSRSKLPPAWFFSPGWLNALNFKLTSPVASLQGYLDLFRRLDDRDYVIDHATQASFLDHMVAYPGGVARDMFLEAWLGNRFASGKLTLAGDSIDFKRIHAPVLIMAGLQDSLATPASVKALLPLLGSAEKMFITVPGGHMGIVSGREAPEAVWPATLNWLKETEYSAYS